MPRVPLEKKSKDYEIGVEGPHFFVCTSTTWTMIVREKVLLLLLGVGFATTCAATIVRSSNVCSRAKVERSSHHARTIVRKSFLASLSSSSSPPYLKEGILSGVLVRGGGQPGKEKKEEEPNNKKDSIQIAPSCQLPDVWAQGPKRGLVFVDAFSEYHGGYLMDVAKDAYGVGVVSVLSHYMAGYFRHTGQHDPNLLSCEMPHLLAEDGTIHEEEEEDASVVQEWKRQIPFDVVGLVCESDAGLKEAELFGVALHLSNHDGYNPARRNKFLMVQAAEQAGLPGVVQQKLCRTMDEARDFATLLGVVPNISVDSTDQDSVSAGDPRLSTTDGPARAGGAPQEEEFHTGVLGRRATTTQAPLTAVVTANPRMCVVKPIRGAASDDVFLCNDIQAVERAFEHIYGSTVFGSPRDQHESVLVQEFASGTEYVADTVSKNGEHKIAALWKYDKRPANGAAFVYHGTELVDANSKVGRSICEYVKRSMDILGVQWGLTHSEVIVQSDIGPRLVEVNCRQHNMDFIPLAMVAVGYNALDMLLAAYLGGNEETTYPPNTEQLRVDWDALPELPTTRLHAAMVHLVCHKEGTLTGLNMDALNEISAMESVFDREIYDSFTEVGSRVEPTINIRTDAGWIHLVNDDKDAFERDYERIVELMPALFEVSTSVVGEEGEMPCRWPGASQS